MNLEEIESSVALRPTSSQKLPDKKALVEQYSPFVRSIAKQVKKSLPARIELEDLVSYGMAGLLEAADRYDSRHGANFSTFSYYRVRGAIYDGLRGMGWVSRHEYQKIRFGERAVSYLENQAARDLATTQDRRGTEERIEELANQVSQLVTIFLTSLEGMEHTEFEDKNTVRQDALVEDRELKQLVKNALIKLPKEDQELIRLYYYKDLSLEEVGQQIGLSKSWTCRRHAQVIEKLTLSLKELMSPPKNKARART